MRDDRTGRIEVRPAAGSDLPAVMNVFDAAMLEADAAAVRERIAGRDDREGGVGVLVAVDGERVLAACLVDPSGEDGHVEAIAVRPGRRDQGIGTALVEAAADRWGPLTAAFDEGVRPFYESLGFEAERIDEDRFRGRRK